MGRGGSGGGGFSGGGGGFRSSGSSFRSSGSSFRSSSSSSRGGGSFGSSGRSSGGGSFSSGRTSSSSHKGSFSSNPIYSSGGTPRPGPGGPTPRYYGTPYRSSGSSWLFPYLVGRQSAKNDAYRQQQYYSNTGGAAPNNGTYNAAPGTDPNQSGTYTAQPQQTAPAKRGLGCLGWFLIGLMIFFALGIIGMASESGNAVKRTKLEGTGGYKVVIDDETGILKEDMNTLKSGLNDFKDKTGVVPAVKTMYEVDFSDYMADQIFSEMDLSEYHFLLIYLVNQVESEEDSYYYMAGDGTHTVLDDSAIETFESQLAYYYQDLDLSYSEFIGKSFSTSADKIMDDGSGNKDSIIVAAVLFLFCLAAFIFMMSRERKLRKQELDLQQQKLDAEILNTPLEQFSTAAVDSTVEDLKKKYD